MPVQGIIPVQGLTPIQGLIPVQGAHRSAVTAGAAASLRELGARHEIAPCQDVASRHVYSASSLYALLASPLTASGNLDSSAQPPAALRSASGNLDGRGGTFGSRVGNLGSGGNLVGGASVWDSSASRSRTSQLPRNPHASNPRSPQQRHAKPAGASGAKSSNRSVFTFFPCLCWHNFSRVHVCTAAGFHCARVATVLALSSLARVGTGCFHWSLVLVYMFASVFMSATA